MRMKRMRLLLAVGFMVGSTVRMDSVGYDCATLMHEDLIHGHFGLEAGSDISVE